jgi:hypothetical protein
MNKVVRHYPVSQLPEDLRRILPEHRLVKIHFEIEPESEKRPRLSDLAGTGTNVHGNDQEVLDHIRDLREGH